MMRRLRSSLLLLLAAAFVVAAAAPAHAQLVVVNRHYKVIAVDAQKSVIHVAVPETGKKAADVIVNQNTSMYVFDHKVPVFAWRLLQPGMKITVAGGETWDFRVKAHKIWLVGSPY